jgi:hypothetical protein
VPAGARSLDHESLDAPAGLADQHRREGVRRDDRQKIRTPQRLQSRGFLAEGGGVEHGTMVGVRPGAGHADGIGGGMVVRQHVQHARHLDRNSRPHDHHGDPGQHRPIERRQVRQLDLLQIVDADRVGMPLPGKEDLHVVRDDAEFLDHAAALDGMRSHGKVGRFRLLASRHKEGVLDPLRHARKRKVAQGAPHVPARIAVLQAPRQDLIQTRAGYDTELPNPRHGLGQAPVGYPDAHASLYDFRQSDVHGVEYGLFGGRKPQPNQRNP